jgi:aspartyl-tRNA(Asn)/glutamyl-tRNA(Gln) amidotransferase subunit A
MMSDLTKLTLAGARDALKKKEITSVELTGAYLDAMEHAKALNAYVTVTAEQALDMAKVSDARLAKGEGGALEGLPLGIKDLFATKGVLTTACSHILDGFKPPYESSVTAR